MAYNKPNKKELEGVFDEVRAIQEVIPHLSISEILNLTLPFKRLPRMTGKPNPASYGYSVEEYENDIVRRPLERSKLVYRSFLFPLVLCLLSAIIALIGPFLFPAFRPSPIAWAVVGLFLGGMIGPVFFNIAWSRKEKYDFANYHRHVLELIGYLRLLRRGIVH